MPDNLSGIESIKEPIERSERKDIEKPVKVEQSFGRSLGKSLGTVTSSVK
jgi:hypothetical protein